MSDEIVIGKAHKIIFLDGVWWCISTIDDKDNVMLDEAEFNRLALEAPLFKKVVDYLNTYSHNNVGRQLLAEIAELEKK